VSGHLNQCGDYAIGWISWHWSPVPRRGVIFSPLELAKRRNDCRRLHPSGGGKGNVASEIVHLFPFHSDIQKE
jgi:hypothetical protein